MSVKRFKNPGSKHLLIIAIILLLLTGLLFYYAMWVMPLFIWLIILGVALISIILFIIVEHPIFLIIESLFGIGSVVPTIVFSFFSHIYTNITNVGTFLYCGVLPWLVVLSWIGLTVYCIIILIRD